MNQRRGPQIRPAAVDLRVGELTLRGVPARDRYPIADAFVETLRRLFNERGLPPTLQAGARPNLRLDDLRVTPGVEAQQIGARLAEAVYEGLGHDSR